MATALLVLMWGSTFTSIKVSLAGCPPVLLAGLRCLIAGLILAGVALLLRRRPHLRAGLKAYVALTAFNALGFYALQTTAIDHLVSGLASVLIYLQPVLTVLLAGAVLGERLGLIRVASALLAFVGVAVIGFDPSDRISHAGIALGVSAACCWSLGTLTAKRVSAQLDPFWVSAGPLIPGGAILLVVAALTERVWLQQSPVVVGAMLWTILIGTAASWLVWILLISSGDVSAVAVSIFLVPVVAIVLGWVLLDEPLQLRLIIGGALVCAGVVGANRRPPSGDQVPPHASGPHPSSRL